MATCPSFRIKLPIRELIRDTRTGQLFRILQRNQAGNATDMIPTMAACDGIQSPKAEKAENTTQITS
jgi:hypothetical protein